MRTYGHPEIRGFTCISAASLLFMVPHPSSVCVYVHSSLPRTDIIFSFNKIIQMNKEKINKDKCLDREKTEKFIKNSYKASSHAAFFCFASGRTGLFGHLQGNLY